MANREMGRTAYAGCVLAETAQQAADKKALIQQAAELEGRSLT